MTHPITGETVEECAERFRRIQASEPGGIGSPLRAAGHLAANDVTEEKRSFYAAVADYLEEVP